MADGAMETDPPGCASMDEEFFGCTARFAAHKAMPYTGGAVSSLHSFAVPGFPG